MSFYDGNERYEVQCLRVEGNARAWGVFDLKDGTFCPLKDDGPASFDRAADLTKSFNLNDGMYSRNGHTWVEPAEYPEYWRIANRPAHELADIGVSEGDTVTFTKGESTIVARVKKSGYLYIPIAGQVLPIDQFGKNGWKIEKLIPRRKLPYQGETGFITWLQDGVENPHVAYRSGIKTEEGWKDFGWHWYHEDSDHWLNDDEMYALIASHMTEPVWLEIGPAEQFRSAFQNEERYWGGGA